MTNENWLWVIRDYYLAVASPSFYLILIMLPTFVLVAGLSLIAILNGHEARTEIRQSSETQRGDGLAVTALVISYGNVAMICLVLFWLLLLDSKYPS